MVWGFLKILVRVFAVACVFLAVPTLAMAGGCGDTIERSVENIGPKRLALVNDTVELRVQGSAVLGTWTADADPDNGAGIHCHMMEITSQVGPGQYNAVVDTTYQGGRSLQTCDVSVSGVSVTVTCDVIFSNTDYAADNFSLTLNGNILAGTNLDDRGTLSATEFCKI